MTNQDHEEGRMGGDQTASTEPLAAHPSLQSHPPLPPAEPWLAAAPFGLTYAAEETRPAGRAPVRWGGVVWGLLLLLFAGGTLWVLSSPARLAAWELWVSTLTPATAWALGIAVVGLVIVVSGLLGAIRSSQRRRARERV